jgi:hypothetical protein
MIKMTLEESAVLRVIARAVNTGRRLEQARSLIPQLSTDCREVAQVILGGSTDRADVQSVADWMLKHAKGDHD